jgi:hypothetical protein
MNAVSTRENDVWGVGRGKWGVVAQQNNYTALFLIICTSVNVYCMKVIWSSFHR